MDNDTTPGGRSPAHHRRRARLQPWSGGRCAARFLVGLLIALCLLSACSQLSRLPWSDDFSDPGGGWLVESDESAVVGFEDGALRVLVLEPNLLAGASAARDYADVHVRVEAAQAAGPDDNEYGLRMRMTDNDQFYSFAISGDGYFQVARYDQGEWTSLTGGWHASEAIRQGASTNVLEVISEGTEMSFLVNGIQLARIEDLTYGHGDIGLYAGSFYESGVDIRFDNLSAVAP